MCDALHCLLDNLFIRFGSKLYRQIVGIPMGTNRHFYPQADTLRVHLTLTLWVQCIVHLRSTF